MDLVHVRSFVEVAERGAVVVAAAELGFTPPAVSQHLAKLERTLDVALFDRAGRRLRLTAAGRAFLPAAHGLLDTEHRARSAAQAPPERPHFVVAGLASAIATIVVPVLESLRGSMRVEVNEREDLDAIRDLRVGSIDVALVQEYDGWPIERDSRLVYRHMATDRLRLVLPPTVDQASTVEDLASVPWLLNGAATRCADATRRLLDRAAIDPMVAGTVADNDTLLALVAAGHGVSVVPELMLTSGRHHLQVGTHELGISRTIYAVSRVVADRSILPLVRALEIAAE